MNWVKRNLFFVIGSVIALALIGFAGFYNYSAWQHNGAELEKLNQAYEDLKRLNNLNPHPGFGKVDNIKLAREQQAELRRFLAQAAQRFERIPALPETGGGRITSEQFASALRQTIDQLTRDAANNGVTLPGNPAVAGAQPGASGSGAGGAGKFNFSFTVQSQRVQFTPPLEPLAVQLGEVKVIAGILTQAKVNSLDQLRRARVSPDDQTGPATDYLDAHSQTNDLAVLTPYEISIHCFTPELAAVLAGFANSPHGIIVKSVNVEPAAAATFTLEQPVSYVPPPSVPPPIYQPRGREGEGSAEAFSRRYGVGGKGYAPPPPVPTYAPQPVAAPGGQRGGLRTVLDERQLRVVMLIQIVKPLAKK